MFVVIPIVLTLCASLFTSSNVAIPFLFLAQLVMLWAVIRDRHLTGAGAFIFMSFLFFAMRPVYVWAEQDFRLFEGLFLINPTKIALNGGMLWATLGMLTFQVGSSCAKNLHWKRWRARHIKAKMTVNRFSIVGVQMLVVILICQLATLVVMVLLASAGRSLYDSALGAYIYDLPALMQAVHIFALLLALERYLKIRNPSSILIFVAASILFILFTVEMRTISIFRGFYLTGLMAGGIAVLARLRSSTGALWLILPVVLLLPTFRMLGEARYTKNDEITAVLPVRESNEPGLIQRYWDFYDGDGDMNIFDTFVAANESRPKAKPYLLSWLYVPLHWVPRAFWETKPKNGTLQDMDFTYGAPYSPGIAGFFLLDGGRLWMLMCMTLLGYLIGFLDWTVLTMPKTYIRFCLYGILVVNAMGLSRYFLWQYFYGVLYALIPCLILARIVGSRARRNKVTANGAVTATNSHSSPTLTFH